MEQKSALSVFNDAMSLAQKVNNRYSQRELLENKAWIFMIHNLLKGEKFPLEDWFETNGNSLFSQFYDYYRNHNCWNGFQEHILNCSGKMHALFVAAVYCLEQANEEHKKACVQSILANKAIDDEVLEILSGYSCQYLALLDVISEILNARKSLKYPDCLDFFQVYLKYRTKDCQITRKVLDLFYLLLTKTEKSVDAKILLLDFQTAFVSNKLEAGEDEKKYHFAQLQKFLNILARRGAHTELYRIVLNSLDSPLYKAEDRVSLVSEYLDEFIAAAGETRLFLKLSKLIAKEDVSAKLLPLFCALQQKIADDRRLSLELLSLADQAWRKMCLRRIGVIGNDFGQLTSWDYIDMCLERDIFSQKDEKWLEVCCKAASYAVGDIGYFATQPLWLALKLKKLIATYSRLQNFKDYAQQIFDEQMDVLESFLEEDFNYIYWDEWEKVLDDLWCEATASDIAKLVHLLAGYEQVGVPMQVWAKSKNFDFTNWGDKLKYTSQVEKMLQALNVD